MASARPTDPDPQGCSIYLTLTNKAGAKIITSSPRAAGWHQPWRPLDLLPSHAPTPRHLNLSVSPLCSTPSGDPWAYPAHPPLKETGCRWCLPHPGPIVCWIPALRPPAWQPWTLTTSGASVILSTFGANSWQVDGQQRLPLPLLSFCLFGCSTLTPSESSPFLQELGSVRAISWLPTGISSACFSDTEGTV